MVLRSIRLRDYDYSQPGAYYVTICVQDHRCLFGDVVDGTMRPNEAGTMVNAVWQGLPGYYPGVDIDAFVVMPNHIHSVIVLTHTVGASPRGCPDAGKRMRGPAPTDRMSLPDVVHRFKSLATARYRHGVYQNGWPPFPGRLWQRNYWERIIRNDGEWDRIRRYIARNPSRWHRDRLYAGRPR